MSDKRDGDTKQLIADAEKLASGASRSKDAPQSTRELVDSAESLLKRPDSAPPQLSPIPLLVVLALVLIAAVIGVYASVGTAMGEGDTVETPE
ncbi:MAG: hypothetical protein AAFQ82_00615 [Myxococcota bacterium]